ncbi:MAG: FdhF/YdeP family oxidoreductase [Archangium sp.]
MADQRKPAAGPGAVFSSLRYTSAVSGVLRGVPALARVNQKNGFDCPGCAWPDPEHRSFAEFCENGARAVAHEADSRRADAAFFAAHSVEELRTKSGHWLEHQGRLVEPMILKPGATHYAPISWDDALQLVADELRALPSPDAAAFYTSGRASNEAAFLYQLLARTFGTNNLPDCSNLCHESSGKGLGTTIGVGKGTVQLSDFDACDCIFVMGQNPGTNHPRMLTTLQAAARRGVKIIAVNPLRERALESFANPQTVGGMLGFGSPIASQYVQVRINGDVAFLKGVMKVVLELGALDHAFLEQHTTGFDALERSLRETSWDELVAGSGVARADLELAGRTYAEAKATIVCWAMGLTQHKNAVGNVREIVNLLSLRGNLGREGAGACPVRGHSNVQGDRTVGIYEAPTESFLARLDAGMGITSPRKHGHDVVGTIGAMERGEVQVFVSLGGNFASATPDTERTARALRTCRLTVQISTKLNRSHLDAGRTALILPCLGRTEDDGGRFVTVEDSMSVVHASRGRLKPCSELVRSEPWIVARLGKRLAPMLAWETWSTDYDAIRDCIEKSIEGFDQFNERVRQPGGFVLRNAASHREWHTSSGKVELSVQPLPKHELKRGELLMMTIRTHDQFNTTIYELNDRYRGVKGERDVIFMNAKDVEELGVGERVTLVRGSVKLSGFRVIPFDIPRGNCATYFPETNALVPLESFADESRTPTSKSVVIEVTRE